MTTGFPAHWFGSKFHDNDSPAISSTACRSPRSRSRLLLALSLAAGLFVQTGALWADTKADINAALGQLGTSSTITNATPDQLRQAIARASYTHHSSASDVATYVTDVLNLRYPTNLANANTNNANLTQRGSNANMILSGGIQGLRALGDTSAGDYATVTLAAANVSYQPAALDAIRADFGNKVISQLKTAAPAKFLSGISGAPTSLPANPDLAGTAAPAVATDLLSTYAARDVTRDSAMTYQVLSAIPAVTGATFTQAERDTSIASVITALQGGSYITPANMNEFVARLARSDTTTIQTVSQTVAASLADETARETFASGSAGFFTAPNGSTGANQALIVLPDATKALMASGIGLAAPGHEGDIASAIAGTISNSNLTAAQQAAGQTVGSVYALDVRRAVVVAGVVAAVPGSAPAITEQYLTDRPITVEANAPAFATTVTRSLPVAVNNANRDAFAGTTAVVTGEYVAAAISDAHFKTKAGVVRAVVVAVPTFAEETVHQVAAQVQSELGALDQGAVATAFAVAIAANSGSSKMADATKAMVAQGVALAFAGNEAKVAKAVADLPTAAGSSAPTDASRAAIAAAVAIAVPAATHDIAAQVGSSLGTNAGNKVGFGGALIAALPATSGVADAAKLIAAGLADPGYSTFANDAARIAFAKALATQSATTKTATNSSLIAAGVTTQLTDIVTSAPLLAAGVATAVNIPANLAPIAAEVARVAPAGTADEIAYAVAKSAPALLDANRTAVAVAVIQVFAPATQLTVAPDVADKIASLENDSAKAGLAAGVAQLVYSTPSAVATVAGNIANHITASSTLGGTGVSPADLIRQGIASAALKSGLPAVFDAGAAPSIVAVADALARGSFSTGFDSLLSRATLANTLVTAAGNYASTTVGVSSVAGDIAISVAQTLASPADKAAAAYQAAKASSSQAAVIAVSVANYGAGADTTTTHPLNDAGKALVAQKVVLASTNAATQVALAIVALIDGDGNAANINQDTANVAKAVVNSAPTQAVAVAAAVAAPNDSALRLLVAQGVAQGLPSGYATSAGPVAAAVAALTGNSVTTKAGIAVAVATAVPSQAVDIADKVATPTVAADKAVIAAAVAAVIPVASQASATAGTAALAAKVAGEITVTGNANAADEIAAIAKAVAAAGGNVSLSIAPDIAKAVATKFGSALSAAAPVISSQVASVSGLTIAGQAAIAKAVAGAVPSRAQSVATVTLSTALTIDNGATIPDSVAGTFATAIPAQAAAIAGTATTFYATSYLSLHPGTTVRAGDIAVSVATSPGVTVSTIPAIATQVAQAIFPSDRAAIGGIADKFAAAVSPGSGNLSQGNFNSQAPGIATGLGTVAAPTGRESSELAGIVAALTEALPIASTSNMTLIATITKNVALVAANYWTSQSVTYKPDDLVGFLVAELLARGASHSVASGSVLAALKTALTSSGSPISVAVVNSVYGNAGTTGNVNLNTAYSSAIVGAGLGSIGDVLSQTTAVTNF